MTIHTPTNVHRRLNTAAIPIQPVLNLLLSDMCVFLFWLSAIYVLRGGYGAHGHPARPSEKSLELLEVECVN